MAWTDGVDRATGYVVTAANWNSYNGTTGSLQHLHDNRELWVPVTASNQDGIFVAIQGIDTCPMSALLDAINDYALISFRCPNDFTTLVEAKIVVGVVATQAAANWDISSRYSGVGESLWAHSGSDTTTTYNVTANKIFAVNAAGLLASLAAGDYVGLKLLLGTAAHTLVVIGAFIRWK